MQLKFVLSLLLVIGFALSSEGRVNILDCVNKNWTRCADQLATEFVKLHQWSGSSFDLCGHRCDYAFKGRVSKLKWVWDGKISCNGLGSGEERGRKGRNGAIQGALNNLFSKLSSLQLQKIVICLLSIEKPVFNPILKTPMPGIPVIPVNPIQ